MVRVLWLLIQIGILAALAAWIFNHPGTVDIHWLDYDIKAQMGVVFIALVMAFATLMLIYNIAGWLLSIPRRFHDIRILKRREKGFRALTIGLSAVAAGDAKGAGYQAYRMRQFLPDERGLPWLLEAQAARLRGDEIEAQGYFERLMKDKDTSFLGVRGLLHTAVENADLDRAMSLARQALAMHPDQPWVIRTVFGLEVQKHEWAAALGTLKKGDRARAWTAEELNSNRIAILLRQSDELQRGGYQSEAMSRLKEAHRLDQAFTPTVIRLANAYEAVQKRRAAIAVVEKAWKEKPHPDLVPVWESLAPPNKPNDMTAHLRWFERLVALKPGDAESQIAAAKAAITDGLWGEAWQYLAMAEKLRPNARLYRLWAQMEEKTGHTESARRYWEKAADAPPDKVWTCRETGRIYEHWSPVAEPHGAFNTIVWDDPRSMHIMVPDSLLNAPSTDLVLEPVQKITSGA